MAVVISRLTALMFDQQQRCEEAGMKAAVLQRHSDMTLNDKEGMICCVIPLHKGKITEPEMWANARRDGRPLLLTGVHACEAVSEGDDRLIVMCSDTDIPLFLLHFMPSKAAEVRMTARIAKTGHFNRCLRSKRSPFKSTAHHNTSQ